MGDAAKIAEVNAWSEAVRYIYGAKLRGKRERSTSYDEKDGNPKVKDSFNQLFHQQWKGVLHSVETVAQHKNGSHFSSIIRIPIKPNKNKDNQP